MALNSNNDFVGGVIIADTISKTITPTWFTSKSGKMFICSHTTWDEFLTELPKILQSYTNEDWVWYKLKYKTPQDFLDGEVN